MPTTPPSTATNTSNRYAPVTPSDLVTDDFKEAPRGFWVGGAGVLQVVGFDNVPVPFTAAASCFVPASGRRIHATGTTATLIVAMY